MWTRLTGPRSWIASGPFLTSFASRRIVWSNMSTRDAPVLVSSSQTLTLSSPNNGRITHASFSNCSVSG
jgi:hypothetical protein